MTASGIYVGQPESWLLDHRSAVLAALREAAAGRISSLSGATKSISRQHMSTGDLHGELLEVRFALWKLKPDTYPNPAERRMMRADFSGC